jgi:hypothetical protein
VLERNFYDPISQPVAKHEAPAADPIGLASLHLMAGWAMHYRHRSGPRGPFWIELLAHRDRRNFTPGDTIRCYLGEIGSRTIVDLALLSVCHRPKQVEVSIIGRGRRRRSMARTSPTTARRRNQARTVTSRPRLIPCRLRMLRAMGRRSGTASEAWPRPSKAGQNRRRRAPQELINLHQLSPNATPRHSCGAMCRGSAPHGPGSINVMCKIGANKRPMKRACATGSRVLYRNCG